MTGNTEYLQIMSVIPINYLDCGGPVNTVSQLLIRANAPKSKNNFI